MEEIKSFLILKKVFSYINEEIKLKLIKYNKNIQNKINIKLINYKLFTGKYIIYETKNKVKEYNANNEALLYEGYFLDGKRNGIGKEYNFWGELIFEGQYKDGIKWNGKYKEKNYYNNWIFEGEYLNGNINGKGKEYYST